MKYRLHENLTILRSLAHRFCKFTKTPHHKWSLTYMTLNLTAANIKHLNLLMTLLNIVQKW